MKRKIIISKAIIVAFSISLITILLFNGCSKPSNDINSSMTSEKILKDAPGKKHHMVVRWAGLPGWNCVCPNCKCPNCPCPLGLCICGGIPDGAVPTLQDYQDGYRNMNAEILNGKLHLIFECDVALSDGTIVISDDYVLTQDELNSFSLNQSVQMLAGTYTVDFSTYTYGEVLIDLEYL